MLLSLPRVKLLVGKSVLEFCSSLNVLQTSIGCEFTADIKSCYGYDSRNTYTDYNVLYSDCLEFQKLRTGKNLVFVYGVSSGIFELLTYNPDVVIVVVVRDLLEVKDLMYLNPKCYELECSKVNENVNYSLVDL